MSCFRHARIPLLLAGLLLIAACWNPFSNPLDMLGLSGGGRDSALPERVENPAGRIIIALGGVPAGWDELIFKDNLGNVRDFKDSILDCKPDAEGIAVDFRPGFTSQSEGSGVRLIAHAPGVVAIRCTVDGEEMKDEVYEVTVPPQTLIQILVAEAQQQLADEAQIDEAAGAGVVKQESASVTGNALGAVIRNRILFINDRDDPELFGAISAIYDSHTPASYYDGVIEAPDQFAPTHKLDPLHDLYQRAEVRGRLSAEEQIAYDQAVLTAAGVFNGDIPDPTQEAFAFRSPTLEQWQLLHIAALNADPAIPDGSGFVDADFPEFAPIQIEVLPEVWKYEAEGEEGVAEEAVAGWERPAFVFARIRPEALPAAVVVLP